MKKGLQLTIVYASFVFHAMPSGMLGVAWPQMRADFGVPLDALGVILFTVTLGYFLASLGNGRFLQAVGLGPALLASWVFATLGVAGYALASAWWVVLLGAFLVGLGGGTLATGLNTFVAGTFSHRHMNWMHANYGLGATLAPLFLAFLSNQGLTWQQSYGMLGGLQGGMGIVILLTMSKWQLAADASEGDTQGKRLRNSHTLRLPVVWLSLLLFLLYVGVETTTGQWSFTLLTQSRRIPALQASSWVSLFWGCLTLGRLLVGFAVERLGAHRVLQMSMGGVLAGALLLSLPTAVSSLPALLLMGFSCAAIFPLLTSDTPRRVGPAHLSNAMGLQNAAASMGLAILPGTAGLLADSMGLEVIGPFTAFLALILWGGYHYLQRLIGMKPLRVAR